jgi:hypothetical protein
MRCGKGLVGDCAGIYLRWGASHCFAKVARTVRRELREEGSTAVRLSCSSRGRLPLVVGAWPHEVGAFIAQRVADPLRVPFDAFAPRCSVRPSLRVLRGGRGRSSVGGI